MWLATAHSLTLSKVQAARSPSKVRLRIGFFLGREDDAAGSDANAGCESRDGCRTSKDRLAPVSSARSGASATGDVDGAWPGPAAVSPIVPAGVEF